LLITLYALSAPSLTMGRPVGLLDLRLYTLPVITYAQYKILLTVFSKVNFYLLLSK
jgi:hypothetical protein